MADSVSRSWSRRAMLGGSLASLATCAYIQPTAAEKTNKGEPVTGALITGDEPGFVELTAKDFTNVNCDADTWTWDDDNVARCKGTPIGVFRSVKPYTNFELVYQWLYPKPGGNSGTFIWTPQAALDKPQKNGLPSGGIEVQVLDIGFKTNYEKSGRKATWFTTHGDVFPVGSSKMTPFEPTSPNGSRSFPREERSKPSGQWNHYYVRAINGEVRLFVNGREVSGGRDCTPASGFICLESEGAEVYFKNMRLRELP